MLVLNDDVLFLVCVATENIDIEHQRFHGHQHNPERPPAVLSLCMTCKRLRSVGAPLIYRKATVCRFGKCQLNIGGADMVAYTARQDHPHRIAEPRVVLSSIKACEPFKRYGKVFAVHLCDQLLLWDRSLSEFVSALKTTLSTFPGLEELRLYGREALSFDEVCDPDSFLPRLRTLTLSDELQTLALVFAATITSLQITRSFTGHVKFPTTIINKGTFKHLRSLKISSHQAGGNCTPELLKSLATHCPHLATLGTLSSARAGPPFITFLPFLARLPDLTVLAIDCFERLGTQDPPHTSDAWEQRREEQTVEVHEQKEEIVRTIAHGVFRHCRQLRTLWMLDQGRASCERHIESCVEDVKWVPAGRPDVFWWP
ncbi:hypothetical protein LTR37_020575 [Vermiconidia calcicola]|uniref:Uncharacterized protein n=1 Tax=Vermiconidia calcicola TaxID=1690605 RepID=A0ACC3MC37_9PEZI|nr:hypothetical protein LTR37_020575 [Vermiconidia calcicola]